jgi:sodium-dependent dicarboxylate transporter 2/3/5
MKTKLSNSRFALLLGPILFTVALLTVNLFPQVDKQQMYVLGCMAWMLVWWITQPVPIGVTSLLPMLLFPVTNILSLKATTSNYASPIIYLFFGGFVLGIALEKHNLHKRIAMNILKKAGSNPRNVVLGSMLATTFLSMWISNTATTVMMLPIGMSIVALFESQQPNEIHSRNFGISLLLGIAYAANLGGMATLIGTPPNLVLAGFVESANMPELGFAQWLFFALPIVTLLFVLVYLLNTRILFPVAKADVASTRTLMNEELKKLGKMSVQEKRVLMVLIVTASAWIFRSYLNQLSVFAAVSDAWIAIASAISLFVIKAGKEKEALLNWADMKKMPWGILLLFGGGISLAKGMESAQLVETIGMWISSIHYPHLLLLIVTVTLFAVFLTEVMSNVALVSVFVPVAFAVAVGIDIEALLLAIPLTLGASCAFMFPISTPPNAIVYGSGIIPMDTMAKAGIVLNILCVLAIAVYGYHLIPVVFKS